MVAVKTCERMSLPLVSVITVTRNAADELRRTLESVLVQKYPRVQFLVIDGGSADGTLAILEEYKDSVEFVSEPDSGVYDAMNKGLDRARGEWVIFMNSGDRFASVDALQSFVDATATNVSLVYSDYLRPAADEPSRLELCPSRPLIGKIGIVGMICHQAILFNKKYFPKPYDLSLRLCADLDILLTLYKGRFGEFRHVAIPLVTYEGGGISEQDYELLHQERELIIARHCRWPVRFINLLNHLRIRSVREIRA